MELTKQDKKNIQERTLDILSPLKEVRFLDTNVAKKQFGRLFSSQKESKYRNEKVEYDGMTFDSKRERDRYIVLKDAERQGIISDLVCQPKFTLLPAQYHEETVQLKTKVKTVRKCDFLATTYTCLLYTSPSPRDRG